MEFCAYKARGYIFDEKGNLKKIISASGVTKHDSHLLGYIMRQSAELRQCSQMSIHIRVLV